MLAGYGWCVLRSSREPYRTTTVEAVDAIDNIIDAADRHLRDSFESWMASLEEPYIKWTFHEQLNNCSGVLLYCVSRNHRSSAVWDMIEWIAKNGPGSYGLLYVHDDEDQAGNETHGRGEFDFSNAFRVHRIANGVITELDDPFLSPIVPTINPSDLS